MVSMHLASRIVNGEPGRFGRRTAQPGELGLERGAVSRAEQAGSVLGEALGRVSALPELNGDCLAISTGLRLSEIGPGSGSEREHPACAHLAF